MRKGRSVVHKTIEDNYSAVVGANHEALAQVLEQVSYPSRSHNDDEIHYYCIPCSSVGS